MDDDENAPKDVGQDLVATIVSSYVKHNTVSAGDLATVIASVYHAPGPAVSASVRNTVSASGNGMLPTK